MTNSIFFELLKISIGHTDCLSRTPSEVEWGELFAMAKKQSLVGVCFVGVHKLARQQIKPPEKLYLTWMGIAVKIQQRNEVVNRQCVEVQRLIIDNGYRSCIFKGQANASLYPNDLRLLRQSGDIDIWIEGGRNRVIELVQKIAPTKDIRETHAQLAIFRDTEVEAHYRPGLIRDVFRNNKLQDYFASCEEECFTNKVSLPCGEIIAPTHKFNAVHQMLHIYHHLFDGGIGLRQVMDYYYVVQNLSPEEKEDVMKTLKSLGVGRFSGALMYVLHKVFSLDCELMLCDLREKDGEFLLDEIMQAGNFGHHDERNKKFVMGSYWQNFFGIMGRNIAYFRFAPWDWLMSPIWRVYHFIWRKKNGYK